MRIFLNCMFLLYIEAEKEFEKAITLSIEDEELQSMKSSQSFSTKDACTCIKKFMKKF